MLPAGLTTNDIEIFSTSEGVKVLQGGVVKPYLMLPDALRQPFQIELIKDVKAQQALNTVFNLYAGDEMEEQFVGCRYGSLNMVPDLIDNSPVEDCPSCLGLQTCKAFDIVCKSPMTASGKRLARQEYIVAIEVAKGHQDIEIADRLGIEITSVRTYLQRAREKMCLNNRVEVARWITNKGVI